MADWEADTGVIGKELFVIIVELCVDYMLYAYS